MFRTLLPPPELRAYVRFFWTARAPAGHAAPERVIPDGCCEVIWQLADTFERYESDRKSRQPDAFLFGQLERAICVAPLGVVDILGIRLTPAGAAGLWGLDVSELEPREYGLDDVLLPAHLPSLALLRETGSFTQRCSILTRWLHGRLRRTEAPAVQRAMAALSLMHRGVMQPSEIADRIGCTRRSLERAFRSSTGLAPAAYLRLRRIDACLPRLRSTTARLATIAADAGFADQAHFTREFHRIAGTSPSEYRREQGVREPLLTEP